MIARTQHILRLEGPRVCSGKAGPAAVGGVLRQVEFAAKEAVRMAFRRSSRRPGRVPAWLSAAEDVKFVGLSPDEHGGTQLYFEAPKFGDVAEEPYREPTLFDPPPQQTDTAFDLLGDIIQDISLNVEDSERYDSGLLHRVGLLSGAALKRGINSIVLLGDRLSAASPPRINSALAQSAKHLYRETPAPKRVRIAGKLDMIRDSDRVFNLILDAGERLRAVWTGGDTAELADYFKKSIVISGTAVFRPSGTLLRVDAEAIAMAGAKDSFFSTMPKPAIRKPAVLRDRKKSGLAEVFGKWPGNESEEELLQALKDMG